jgi:hypothetical protein
MESFFQQHGVSFTAQPWRRQVLRDSNKARAYGWAVNKLRDGDFLQTGICHLAQAELGERLACVHRRIIRYRRNESNNRLPSNRA